MFLPIALSDASQAPAPVAPGVRERRAISLDTSNLIQRKRGGKAEQKKIPLVRKRDAIPVQALAIGRPEQGAVGNGPLNSAQGQPVDSSDHMVEGGSLKLI